MSDALFSVKDQVVLVSGASRGIGRAVAQGFAQRGAKVIITGRDRAVLELTAREIAPEGTTVRPVVCDVAKKADIDNLVLKQAISATSVGGFQWKHGYVVSSCPSPEIGMSS